MTLPIRFEVPPLLLLLGRQAASTRRGFNLHLLLLRTAVDTEVHGGFIEARSVTDVTCRHFLEAYWEVLILLLLLHHL